MFALKKAVHLWGQFWGPIFSNFYMSDFEHKVFDKIKKLSIYLRSVDDILILDNDINEIYIVQDIFQKIQSLILPLN